MLNKRSVPWLRKTEYISTEQSTSKPTFKAGEARYETMWIGTIALSTHSNLYRSSSVKEKLREESLKYLTKDRVLEIIEEGFETARTPVNQFYLIVHFPNNRLV